MLTTILIMSNEKCGREIAAHSLKSLESLHKGSNRSKIVQCEASRRKMHHDRSEAPPCHLGFYEEILGDLYELVITEGKTIAKVGKISVALPLEMESKLRSLVGSRIAILHTDIQGKEYLFRVLQETKPDYDQVVGRDYLNPCGKKLQNQMRLKDGSPY
jgi:hypothetical protein